MVLRKPEYNVAAVGSELDSLREWKLLNVPLASRMAMHVAGSRHALNILVVRIVIPSVCSVLLQTCKDF